MRDIAQNILRRVLNLRFHADFERSYKCGPIRKAMPGSLTNNESISDPVELDEEHKYLLANRLVREDGFGPPIDLGSLLGRTVAIQLEIDHVVQQKALSLSIWGSPDGTNWGTVPLVSLPPKHYCGNYSVLLDLSQYPEVCYLRASWKTTSWEHSASATLFGFSVIVEPSAFRHRVAGRASRAVMAASGNPVN